MFIFYISFFELIFTYAQEEQEDEFFIYDSIMSGLKIDYPSNWSYVESYAFVDPYISLTFFPQDDYNKTVLDVQMYYTESKNGIEGNFPQNPKLDAIVKFIDDPRNNITTNTSRMESQENITIINNDNKKIKAVKEIFVNDDLNRKSIRLITVEDTNPIIIGFIAPLQEFSKYQPIFNKMINSVKLY
jgi:hypothetical protein